MLQRVGGSTVTATKVPRLFCAVPFCRVPLSPRAVDDYVFSVILCFLICAVGGVIDFDTTGRSDPTISCSFVRVFLPLGGLCSSVVLCFFYSSTSLLPEAFPHSDGHRTDQYDKTHILFGRLFVPGRWAGCAASMVLCLLVFCCRRHSRPWWTDQVRDVI